MFVKLLKHEWRANRGLIGLMCAIIAIAGPVSGGVLRYMTWSAAMGNDLMVGIYMLVLVLSVVAVLGCCIGVMYLLVYRFYQSRFTDQGYLMLTLPVTTHQQLLASIANTVIGVVLVGLTAVVSVAVAMGIFLSSFDQTTNLELTKIIVDGIGQAAETINSESGSLLLKIGIQGPISFLADIVLFMLALTVGAQAYKHPILKGAAVYLGVDILLTESCGVFGMLVENSLLTSAVACLLYGILAVGAYLLMYRRIDRKLNLQ